MYELGTYVPHTFLLLICCCLLLCGKVINLTFIAAANSLKCKMFIRKCILNLITHVVMYVQAWLRKYLLLRITTFKVLNQKKQQSISTKFLQTCIIYANTYISLHICIYVCMLVNK